MSRKPTTPKAILKIVEDSLDLLGTPDLPTGQALLADPLPSLYEQCLEIAETSQTRSAEPIRTIHHFACTGGTLICRHLAATPNARLLSEIDPLSPLASPHFSPTDLILQLRSGIRPTDPDLQTGIFLAGLETLYAYSVQAGERLILRDHTHSHFCTGSSLPDRQTLRAVVAAHFETRSVVTVRHPLDSFLSLLNNKWLHFTPFTLDEYSRRYLAFLDAYDDQPVLQYERFVDAPEETLAELCEILDLGFDADLMEIATDLPMTGGSGRRSAEIERRSPRPVPEDVQRALPDSPHYHALCDRMDYDPRVRG